MIDHDSERLNQTLDRINEGADRTWEVQSELSANANKIALMLEKALPNGNTNTSTISINGSGAVALILSLIGVMAIVVAVASVVIVSSWRAADMQELTTLRQQVAEYKSVADQAAAYGATHERRLNNIETGRK